MAPEVQLTPEVKVSQSPSNSPHSKPNADKAAYIASLGFPVLVIIGGIVGYFFSSAVQPISGWTTPLLGIVMFGMGLTLTPKDFALVIQRPLPVLVGVIAQYVIMPCIAVALVWIMRLPAEIAAGVILVGCAPGGTSSNVVSYLARGDVALSVTMTSVSTLIAPVLTPLLTLWLAGQYIPLDAVGMAKSIVTMVFIPVILGLVIRLLLPGLVERLMPALPWVSVLAIATIVAIVVRGSRNSIAEAGLMVLAAVILHNTLGYLLGWATGKLTGQGPEVRRTMAIEVGMQNSGMAASLASVYMSPMSALPGAVFAVWHNLSGALLASLCRLADKRSAKL